MDTIVDCELPESLYERNNPADFLLVSVMLLTEVVENWNIENTELIPCFAASASRWTASTSARPVRTASTTATVSPASPPLQTAPSR